MNFSKLKDNQLRGKYVSLLSTDGERCVKRISTISPNEILLKGRCTISRESGIVLGAGKWAGVKATLITSEQAEALQKRINSIRKSDPERCTSKFLSKRKYPLMSEGKRKQYGKSI